MDQKNKREIKIGLLRQALLGNVSKRNLQKYYVYMD